MRPSAKSDMTGDSELRVGDREREAAITALGEHYAAGRLGKDEYDERAAAALAARTRGGLTPLFADLPGPDPGAGGPPGGSATRTRDASGRDHGRRPFAAWPAARIVLVALLVALAATGQIPWSVAAIALWLCWLGIPRSGWHCSRGHRWDHRPRQRGWHQPVPR